MEIMDLELRQEDGRFPRAGQPQDTTERIKRVFIHSLSVNLGEADLDYVQTLDEVVGFDSVAAIEFVAALEKEFSITIEPELLRLDFVRDLSQLRDYIDTRLAQGRQRQA